MAGNALSPEERKKCCQVAKPGTILDWFRQLAARKYDSSKRKVGRPQKGTQPRPGPVGYPLLRDHVKRHHVTPRLALGLEGAVSSDGSFGGLHFRSAMGD